MELGTDLIRQITDLNVSGKSLGGSHFKYVLDPKINCANNYEYKVHGPVQSLPQSGRKYHMLMRDNWSGWARVD